MDVKTRFAIMNFIFGKFSAVPVAQWIARWTSNPEVAGSNPAGDADFFFFFFFF